MRVTKKYEGSKPKSSTLKAKWTKIKQAKKREKRGILAFKGGQTATNIVEMF